MTIQSTAVTWRKIDHVAIRVSNLRTSLEFYAGLFGAKIALSVEPVIANLTIDDMIDIAAYTASRDPGGPDLRPPTATAKTTEAGK